jgi:hypothetical protein
MPREGSMNFPLNSLSHPADERKVKMLKKHKTGFAAWISVTVLALGLVLPMAPTQAAQEIQFDTLEIGTAFYTNVVVLNYTDTDVFIQHAGGLSNFKIENLNPQVLAQLTGRPNPTLPQESKAGSFQDQIATRINEQIASNPELQQAFGEGWQPGTQPELPPIPTGFIVAFLGIFLFIHLFFCFCAKLIVEKTGQPAGFLIWLPVLQMFPLLRAANMPAWWFLLMLLPFLNIIACIMWCFKIVEARGKSVVWAIFLLLPFTNFLAFLYLAFSSADSYSDKEEPPDLPLLRAA